jgi:hypothetical protein
LVGYLHYSSYIYSIIREYKFQKKRVMKKLLFVVGIVANTFVNAQEDVSVVTLSFERYFGFTAGSKANVNSGFNIQSDSTYKINRVGFGSNNIKIDLKNKTFENIAVVSNTVYNLGVQKIENVQIKNDTLSFFINAKTRDTNQPYIEYFKIVLHPEVGSIFSINMWVNPKYGNIGGTYLDTSLAKMTVN